MQFKCISSIIKFNTQEIDNGKIGSVERNPDNYQYENYREDSSQMASALADFKDEVLEEGQGNFIDLSELP